MAMSASMHLSKGRMSPPLPPPPLPSPFFPPSALPITCMGVVRGGDTQTATVDDADESRPPCTVLQFAGKRGPPSERQCQWNQCAPELADGVLATGRLQVDS